MFRVSAMGDSITAGGPTSWAIMLMRLRPNKVIVYNHASPGATSTTLITGMQPTRVINDSLFGLADYSTLIAGGDDEAKVYALDILFGDYQGFVDAVSANLEGVMERVSESCLINQIVATVPDIGIAPKVKKAVGLPLSINFGVAASEVNDKIKSFVSGKYPLADFQTFGEDFQEGLTLAGVTVTGQQMFAADGFHPSWISQGLLANVLVNCAVKAYSLDVTGLLLSDQEILTFAGIVPVDPGPTWIDISKYVIF